MTVYRLLLEGNYNDLNLTFVVVGPGCLHSEETAMYKSVCSLLIEEISKDLTVVSLFVTF